MKIVILFSIICFTCACTNSDETSANDTSNFDDAAEPANEGESLASLAPPFEDYFVVEGDLLLTAREMAEYGQQSSIGEAEQPPSAELIVLTVGGVPQYYPEDSRILTYAYDTDSFAFAPSGAMSVTIENLESAMREWEDICLDCGIAFERVNTDEPVEGNVWFVVRYVGSAPYVASAFFPNYHSSRRYLNVAQSFFTTQFDPKGVMRHELGHTLGYRHEHIRGVPACKSENDEWMPVTPYDPHSVMHYFCGGGGSFDLEFSETDRNGHAQLYRN